MKTRGQDEFGRPADAVDKRKKNHIYHVAEYYMMINHIENFFCRIDVIEIFIRDGKHKINYLKNCVQERPFKKRYFEEREYEWKEFE